MSFCPKQFNNSLNSQPSLMDTINHICYISEFDCMQSHDCPKNYWNVPDDEKNDMKYVGIRKEV